MQGSGFRVQDRGLRNKDLVRGWSLEGWNGRCRAKQNDANSMATWMLAKKSRNSKRQGSAEEADRRLSFRQPSAISHQPSAISNELTARIWSSMNNSCLLPFSSERKVHHAPPLFAVRVHPGLALEMVVPGSGSLPHIHPLF